MRRYRIWNIYSSRDVCTAIRADCSIPFGVRLDFTAVRTNSSLKKLFSGRRKRAGPLKVDDYVIAIDHTPNYMFKIDKQDSRLLHFPSLSSFMAWIESCKENEKEEALPLIAEKKN